MKADGGELRPKVPVAGGRPARLDASGCDVAWSPRGDEVAYDDHGGGGIWAMHPNGTRLRCISRRGIGPRWSANGSQLAVPYLLGWVGPGRSNVHDSFGVVRADGTGFHVVTTHAYNEYGVAWSPHGQRILYGGDNRTGIYVTSPNGRNKHRVTTDSPPQTELELSRGRRTARRSSTRPIEPATTRAIST